MREYMHVLCPFKYTMLLTLRQVTQRVKSKRDMCVSLSDVTLDLYFSHLQTLLLILHFKPGLCAMIVL